MHFQKFDLKGYLPSALRSLPERPRRDVSAIEVLAQGARGSLSS